MDRLMNSCRPPLQRYRPEDVERRLRGRLESRRWQVANKRRILARALLCCGHMRRSAYGGWAELAEKRPSAWSTSAPLGGMASAGQNMHFHRQRRLSGPLWVPARNTQRPFPGYRPGEHVPRCIANRRHARLQCIRHGRLRSVSVAIDGPASYTRRRNAGV